MKKLLGIVVLGLLLCNTSFASDRSLLIFVDPPDASCKLKKKNKIIEIKSGQKFTVPGLSIPAKTVIYIICKKDGYKTVIDRLKFSKIRSDINEIIPSGLFGDPYGVVAGILYFSYGTKFLKSDGTPAHQISLPKGEGTLIYKKGKKIKLSDLSAKELRQIKEFLN